MKTGETTRALTVYQPYAQLSVLGLKKNETRGWSTNIRGRIAIHAAKRHPDYIYDTLPEKTLITIYEALDDFCFGPLDTALPIGAVVGTVEIVDCLKIVQASDVYEYAVLENGAVINGAEYLFGDYREGRYAWPLKNPIIFDEPIPAKGSQGFWNWLA